MRLSVRHNWFVLIIYNNFQKLKMKLYTCNKLQTLHACAHIMQICGSTLCLDSQARHQEQLFCLVSKPGWSVSWCSESCMHSQCNTRPTHSWTTLLTSGHHLLNCLASSACSIHLSYGNYLNFFSPNIFFKIMLHKRKNHQLFWLQHSSSFLPVLMWDGWGTSWANCTVMWPTSIWSEYSVFKLTFLYEVCKMCSGIYNLVKLVHPHQT